MTTRTLAATLTLGSALLLGSASSAAQPAPSRLLTVAGPLVLAEYLKIHDALASDRADGVVEAAATLRSIAEKRVSAVDERERPLFQAVVAAAAGLEGDDIAKLRAATKPLSVAVDALLRAAGTAGWQLYHCPMAEGYWIQASEGVRNPYYGAEMLACGGKVDKIAR